MFAGGPISWSSKKAQHVGASSSHSCSCEMPGASLGSGTTAAPTGAAAGAAAGTGTATAAAATSAAAVPCAAAAVLIFNRALKLAVHVLLRCCVLRCRRSDEPPAILHAALTREHPGPLLQRP